VKQLKSDQQIEEICQILEDNYPEPETGLDYQTPFQLLIAVILSAQSTDKQVNKVTKKLFAEYNSPQEIAEATPEEIQEYVKGVGLYRNKSKYLVNTCQMLIDDYEGQIPTNRQELMKLPGVGRKTANVVMSCAFGKAAMPVDTHVFRVANRLGLVDSDRTREVEEQLMEVIPKSLWSSVHHWLIFHGREVCKARSPLCEECSLVQHCDYYQK
jgi:endonuclease-3